MTTTRRDAAAAGPIPGSPMPRPGRGELSQGHLPAHRRRAVPTREYQCGGQPIHTAPARRPIPQAARPPPPQHVPTATHHADHARSVRPACCPQNHAIHQANRGLDRPFHIRALSGLRRRSSGCSAVRGGHQRAKQACKLDIGTPPRVKPRLVWGCSNDLELPVEAATQQELRPPRVIGRGHHDDRTPSSSRCQVADHAGLSSGRVRSWLRAQHFDPLAGCTQLVGGRPARIAAIGDDQHRCDVLVQQHQGRAEALTTATGEDHQGVGPMGGLGCELDQDARGDAPQPANHDDHQPQAEDPAPRRPSAAAPDLGWGWLPSGIAPPPRRSQPRPPPPGVGGHQLHHESSDRDHNGPRGGIARRCGQRQIDPMALYDPAAGGVASTTTRPGTHPFA